MEKILNFNPYDLTICLKSLRQIVSCSVLPIRTVATLSYKILGEGTSDPPKPPVFLFHGIIGNKSQWKGIGKTIGNVTRRTVVAVDLRNHGNSSHSNSHKYSELAADVLHLLEKLGAREVSLIGHSMGGRTAMCVALMAPQKVAGLLVLDISPISTPSEYKEYIPKVLAAMKAVNFKNPKLVSVARREAKKQLKDVVTNEYFMEAILSNIKEKPDGSIGWLCNLDALISQHKNWSSFPKAMRKHKYDGPTLFIGGQLSDYLPPDDLTEIRELFPRAVITYVPRTGHMVQIDDPKSFLELTISFLKSNRYRDPIIKK